MPTNYRTTSIIHPLQAVSACVYANAVCEAARLPHDFVRANTHRITRAYTNGEPVWMIAQELQMLHRIKAPIREHVSIARTASKGRFEITPEGFAYFDI